MRTGGASSLNPYAAAYVPLFKRGASEANKEYGSAQDLNSGNEVAQCGRQAFNTYPQGQHRNVSQSHPQRSSEFVASASQYPNESPEKLNFDEDFDMDLAYLQMIFPGISEESLSDVYLANNCDLDFSVDMLNQLEIHPDDSSDKLPDTLDIGDVPECGSVKAPEEAKNATSGAPTRASTDASAKSLSGPFFLN